MALSALPLTLAPQMQFNPAGIELLSPLLTNPEPARIIPLVTQEPGRFSAEKEGYYGRFGYFSFDEGMI